MTYGTLHHEKQEDGYTVKVFKMNNGRFIALVCVGDLKMPSKDADTPEQADEFAVFIAEEMINMGVI